MGKDQNDQSNQQTDSKPKQEAFEDGTKKKETNPANPTAKQNGQPGNEKEKSSTFTTNKTTSTVPGDEKHEEETADAVTSKSPETSNKKGTI
jgi:hypothetical protein